MPHPNGAPIRPSGRMDKVRVRCHAGCMFRRYAFVLLLQLFALPCGAGSVAGFVTVVSGDTIQIDGVTLRLAWIDAPEPRQTCHHADGRAWACGASATRALSDAVWRKSVHCNQVTADPNGAAQAICTADGLDLGEELVRQGWAVVREGASPEYEAEQNAARTAQLGIWEGSFELPWLWRGER